MSASTLSSTSPPKPSVPLTCCKNAGPPYFPPPSPVRLMSVTNKVTNMDPLTLANTFATVVQLVGMFKQEHQEAKDANSQKFMEWLDYHRHEDIKNLIFNTAALQSEVVNLLRQDSAVILAKLD